MGTKMKGIYKGFKYTLSQIFVVKERDEIEIEIGHPTDVKHVAHIGWDGSSGNAPSWMNEFRTGPNFASASIGRTGSSLSPWSPKDCVVTKPQNSGSEIFDDVVASPQLPTAIKKKQKRRKPKSNSSPKSKSPTSVRSSRTSKTKTKFSEGDTTPINIEVA